MQLRVSRAVAVCAGLVAGCAQCEPLGVFGLSGGGAHADWGQWRCRGGVASPTRHLPPLV